MTTRAVQTRLRWTNEILFSLNIGWIAIWYVRARNSFTWLHSSSLVQYLYWHTRHTEPETVLVQVLWWIPASLIVFIVFYMLSRLWREGVIFSAVIGIGALLGFPLFALGFPDYFFHPFRIASNSPWLGLEITGIVICGIVYYLGKWTVPPASSMIILLLHFSLWTWVTGTGISPSRELNAYGLRSFGIWISTCFYWCFPTVGFLASLAWLFYLRPHKATVAELRASPGV